MDVVSTPLVDNQTDIAHDAKMLGNSALRHVQTRGQGVDTHRTVLKQLNNANASPRRQHLQDACKVVWICHHISTR
jgi:hypothetical protein